MIKTAFIDFSSIFIFCLTEKKAVAAAKRKASPVKAASPVKKARSTRGAPKVASPALSPKPVRTKRGGVTQKTGKQAFNSYIIQHRICNPGM